MTSANHKAHQAPPFEFDGLLIAGGHGRRAGGPKALKQTEEGPLWRVQVARLQGAGCAHVVAVLHPQALPDSTPPRTTLVAAAPDAPMFSSLQLGLATLARCASQPHDAAAPENHAATPGLMRPVLVLPVDCPMPAPTVAVDLLAATRGEAADAWQVARPRYGRRHGHPLLLAPSFARRLLDQDSTMARLDRLIGAMAADQALSVQVADEGILANFNHDGISR